MNDIDLLSGPIFFEPNRVWRCYTGGKLLDAFTGKMPPLDGHFPEDWLASTTVAQNGPNQQAPREGLSQIRVPHGSPALYFKDLLSAHPQAALGLEHFSENDGIGVLCKFLDSAIRLPIQCHPDIPFAKKYYHSDHGKSEAWFILDTRIINGVEPYILMGFKPGIEPERFKKAVVQQDIAFMENALHRVSVVPGEMYFIPGRLPHAIGPGVFLMEVQEPTDWVVQPEKSIGDTQLTDADMWGPLSPEIGLSCFDYAGQDTQDNILKKVKLLPGVTKQLGGGFLERIIDKTVTPCFQADRLTIQDDLILTYDAPWYIAIMVKGACMIQSERRTDKAVQGDCFFVSNRITQLHYQAQNGTAELYIITHKQP